MLLLGEIGLDYYWKPYDTKLQAEVFVQQMQIAKAARKPISIHTRDAWTDTIELLRSHSADHRASMHHALLYGHL